MEVNTIEHVAGIPHGRFVQSCLDIDSDGLCEPLLPAVLTVTFPHSANIDRAELERRLVRGLLKHKFVVMIDDEEAAGVARDLAEEVLR